MSHHSQHRFITQYISLRGTAVNELYRMIRMGVASHVIEVTEQRPMNNEHVYISGLRTSLTYFITCVMSQLKLVGGEVL